MKFRKKPIVIEAEQYKKGMEDGFEERYIDSDNHNITWGIPTTDDDVCILTPYIKNSQDEFIYLISNGDWIITEINGQRSTCNSDIFKEIYESVDE